MIGREAELIDIHCHYTPAQFPGAPDGNAAARWPCYCNHANGKALLKFGEKPFRNLDARSWDTDRRLSDMDADGISVQVLSPMPELLSYWLDAPATALLAQHVNGAIAEIAARRPDRFWALGTVPMQDPAMAVAALPRLKADGFRGIEIGSNINGRYLGEAEFEQVFAAAADLGLAIFVHALHPLQAPHLKSFPDLIPFAGFMTDTGLCAASLIMSGIMERFPALRIGLSHGGGVIAPIIHRLEQGWRTTRHFGGKLETSPRELAARFFVDSLVYDADYAKYLAMLMPGRVCLGTDYPYMIEQRQPRAFIASVAKEDADPVWNAAAKKFLC
jgi:aminocarboxymuconate-semialdehyde decarboxylase